MPRVSNLELMAVLIVKKCPGLVFNKKELYDWLIESGETVSNTRRILSHDFKQMPVREVIKGRYRLLADPADFVTYEPPKPVKPVPTNVDLIKEIIEYLNKTIGSRYRGGTADSAKINARLKEGFTVEDFKTVINKKSKEWMGTNMEAYLRPETLFGNKFESYLNQIGTTRPTSKAEEMAGYSFTKYLQGEES